MSRPRVALLCALFLVVLPACDPEPEPRTERRSTQGSTTPESRSPSNDAWDGWPEGWSRFPEPPEIREGDSWLWTGAELLVAGGCDPDVEGECRETRRAFAFEPAARTWRSISPAPLTMAGAAAVWTGDEAIFLRTSGEKGRIDGAAYDPTSNTWRRIRDAPIRRAYGGVRVWTGDELIVWGGGDRGKERSLRGAAYDASSDTWRPISEAPFGLNLVSGVWSGEEVLVFGSLLSGANRAPTPTSVGAAYDPASDTWRELPPSALSPQATSAVWIDDRLVAWDYEVHSQEYDPVEDRWSAPMRMPLSFSECYPDSIVVSGLLLAWFCGYAALYDEDADGWMRIGGGPLERTIYSEAYRRDLKAWRFADLVPAGSVVVMPMQGLTLNRRGIACYGCEGSPISHWVYRPPQRIVPDPVSADLGKGAVRRAASAFLSSWLLRENGRLPGLATPGGLRTFEARVPDPGLRPDYRFVRIEDVGDGFFEASIVLFDRSGEAPRRRISLVLGPGRSIGGDSEPLLLVHVRR